MSSNQPPPSLDQYPGYFPAAKPPFWTRAKVGTVAGICGLLVGLGGGAGASSQPESQPDKEESAVSAADLDAAVDNATDELEQDLEEQADDLDEQAKALDEQAEEVKAAEAKLKAAQQGLAAYKKKAATAQKKAVARAIASERAKAPAPLEEAPTVQQPVDAPSTDPQFGTCGEANDNGYGPYRSGVDPEYDWYDDRDDDGIVCES